MRKHMPLLRGLAILAVVCNHAAGWGYTAMFWWVQRYRQVSSVPNYEQLGSLSYYGLVVVQQLALFSVPAFLFISGYFIAYAARGDPPMLSWKIVRAQITRLLWPYLVWSLVIFIGDGVQGKRCSFAEYIGRLVTGGAVPAYFFVPLLGQFYLLSPLIARLGKARGGLLIAVSAFIQLTATALIYLPLLGVTLPLVVYGSGWLFIWQALYFPLGVVCGFHYGRLKPWLTRARWGLLAATVVFGVLSVLESESLYRAGFNAAWVRGGFRFSTALYAVAFVLCFLAFDEISVPCARAIHYVGSQSYGIYLLHPKILELVARVIYHIAPWILAHQVVYQPLLVVSGVGISLLFMACVVKSRVRKFARYLFG